MFLRRPSRGAAVYLCIWHVNIMDVIINTSLIPKFMDITALGNTQSSCKAWNN